MTHPTEFYERGRRALSAGKAVRAATLFQQALAEEEKLAPVRRQMAFLSFYGLALSLAYKPTHEYIEYCQRAAKQDSFDPDLQANLANVYLLAGKRSKALQSLVAGLRLEPSHRRLHELFKSVDRRQRPLVPTLGRDHFLNRTAGRLRARLAR